MEHVLQTCFPIECPLRPFNYISESMREKLSSKHLRSTKIMFKSSPENPLFSKGLAVSSDAPTRTDTSLHHVPDKSNHLSSERVNFTARSKGFIQASN